jgi:hypothetical protein
LGGGTVVEHNIAFSSAGPASLKLYEELLTALNSIEAFREEMKKTCIHLVRGSAFAGIRPRKQHLLLTIKALKPIKSSRILKAERVSKNRWHLELKLASMEDIDSELLSWLRDAYDLCI